MSYDPHYPLGTPVNRSAAPALRKVVGRPNWFLDAHDRPYYVEPDGAGQQPAQPEPPAPEQVETTQPESL